MKLRQTESELRTQEYTHPEKFNDDIADAIHNFRLRLKEIAEEHSEVWRTNSQTVYEYEAIRKAARQDIINEIGILLANYR